MVKIVICVPVYGDTRAQFTHSLANMIAVTGEASFQVNGSPSRLQIRTLLRRDLLPFNRNELAIQAMEEGADFVLWADADMVFPANALLRLLGHQVDIVGANCRRRQESLRSTAEREDRNEVITTVERAAEQPLERVHQLGFGLTLMRGPILWQMARDAEASSEPLFHFQDLGGRVVLLEDHYFFNRARKLDIAVHVDHSLSMEVGHIAETVLTFPR